MDKIQSFIFSPLILTPLAVIVTNRILSFFYLEWDKLNASNFERIKNRLIDSSLISIFVLMLIFGSFVLENNIKITDFIKVNLNQYTFLILFLGIIFFLFISVISLYDMIFNNILPRKKLIIYYKNEEYSATKGHDGSLHLRKNKNHDFLSYYKKMGKVFIDESNIEYRIEKEESIINEFILKRVSEYINEPLNTIKLNVWKKTAFSFIISVFTTYFWNAIYLKYHFQGGICIANIMFLILFFVIFEVLSIIYIPALVKTKFYGFFFSFFGFRLI